MFSEPWSMQGLARSQQVQQDSLKREQEARSSAASLRAKFQQLCEEMGIKVGSPTVHCDELWVGAFQGQKVREELKNLFSELPDIFQQTIGGLSSLSPALNFYRSTIEHNTGRWMASLVYAYSRAVGADQWSCPSSCPCCTTSLRMGM